MFGETTISYVKICNHPIETTIYKWLFGVPGNSICNDRRVPPCWVVPFFHLEAGQVHEAQLKAAEEQLKEVNVVQPSGREG